MNIYKQKTIYRRILPSTFTLQDLGSVCRLAEEVHRECIKQLKNEIQEKIFIPDVKIETDYEINDFIKMNYNLLYEVTSSNGSYINFFSLDDLNSYDVPDNILRLKISNLTLFKLNRSHGPSTYFEIQFDFSEVKIFDLVSSPTSGTINDSSYFICSTSHTFADGLSERFSSTLSKFSNLLPILHASSVYDVSLYFVVIPTSTAIVYILKERLPDSFNGVPIYLQILSVFSFLFLLLLTYRLLFNIGKWLLPYLEIKEQEIKLKGLFRFAYLALMAGIISTIGYNFILYTLKILGFIS